MGDFLAIYPYFKESLTFKDTPCALKNIIGMVLSDYEMTSLGI